VNVAKLITETVESGAAPIEGFSPPELATNAKPLLIATPSGLSPTLTTLLISRVNVSNRKRYPEKQVIKTFPL
jgi:hypothetical protein